ncbi:MAG: hypothetical protein N2444_00850 [Methylocystis sp.]|nr:hypothetical protein [Methylocystis sp.]
MTRYRQKRDDGGKRDVKMESSAGATFAFAAAARPIVFFIRCTAQARGGVIVHPHIANAQKEQNLRVAGWAIAGLPRAPCALLKGDYFAHDIPPRLEIKKVSRFARAIRSWRQLMFRQRPYGKLEAIVASEFGWFPNGC